LHFVSFASSYNFPAVPYEVNSPTLRLNPAQLPRALGSLGSDTSTQVEPLQRQTLPDAMNSCVFVTGAASVAEYRPASAPAAVPAKANIATIRIELFTSHLLV
jgi:hypothetical protein